MAQSAAVVSVLELFLHLSLGLVLVMSCDLTPKQEKFCQAYIETGNASEAYRLAYNAAKMNADTINRKAKELLDNGKITARLDAIKARHAKRHDCKVDDLLGELEEARTIAKMAENPTAMVSATMGKAKLLGLDKKLVEHSGSIATLDLTKSVSSEQIEAMAKEVMIKQGYEFDE